MPAAALLSTVHTFETLSGYNELNQPVSLCDFHPERGERVVWGNCWMNDVYGGAIALEADEGKYRFKIFHLVQQLHEVSATRWTLNAPIGETFTMDAVYRPIRFKESEDAEERVLVLMVGVIVDLSNPLQVEAQRAHCQLDFVQGAMILCDQETGDALSSNLAARKRYPDMPIPTANSWNRSTSTGSPPSDPSDSRSSDADFPGSPLHRTENGERDKEDDDAFVVSRSHLFSVLNTYRWENPRDLETMHTRIGTLMLSDPSFTVELEKADARQEWYAVTLTPTLDPATGKVATLVSEHDISLLKFSEALLREEQTKNETLLYSMLPEDVVAKLRQGRRVRGKHHRNVCVLFADVCDFTVMSANSPPQKVCDLLDNLFSIFDTISQYFGVVKLDTIGDCYMLGAGLDDGEDIDKATSEVIDMAFAMIQGAAMVLCPHDKSRVRIRVGVHRGPLISGVVGLRMPQFTVFGDTVNTAARIESLGAAGRVHASREVGNMLAEQGYYVDHRGVVEAKGLGELQTSWIVNPKRESEQRIRTALDAAVLALQDLLDVRRREKHTEPVSAVGWMDLFDGDEDEEEETTRPLNPNRTVSEPFMPYFGSMSPATDRLSAARRASVL